MILVVIGGSLLFLLQKKRRRMHRARARGGQGHRQGGETFFSEYIYRIGLFGRKRRGSRAKKQNPPASVPTHEVSVNRPCSIQQVHPAVENTSRRGNDDPSSGRFLQGNLNYTDAVSGQLGPGDVLVRESFHVPKWLPELPSHEAIILSGSAIAAPRPVSMEKFAQKKPTLQLMRKSHPDESEGPLSPPPRAFFSRQSTLSSNYTDSSAPSSRPSTIVYASPLRPRPVPRITSR